MRHTPKRSRASRHPLALSLGAVVTGNRALIVTARSIQEAVHVDHFDLTHGLPTHPYHHEGAWALGRYLNSPWARPTSLAQALELIDTVTAAALAGARRGLGEIVARHAGALHWLAIKACPPWPEDVLARLLDLRLQTQADGILYRKALAAAATELGLTVVEVDPTSVFEQLNQRLPFALAPDHFKTVSRPHGAGWTKDHQLAMMSACLAQLSPGR